MRSTATQSRAPPTATPTGWVYIHQSPTRADTREILHARMLKGSVGSGRGAQRFVRETAGRIRRGACASGKLTLRADSGFWSGKVIKACVDHDIDFSITVAPQPVITTVIDQIPEDAWVDISYAGGGTAQVAEALWDSYRLIVRRTRIDNDPNRPVLSAGWRHHVFVTNRHGAALTHNRDHGATPAVPRLAAQG